MIKRILYLFLSLLLALSLVGCAKTEDEQKQIMKAAIIHFNEINYKTEKNMNQMMETFDNKGSNPEVWLDLDNIKNNFNSYKKEVDSIKIDDGLSQPRKDTLERLKKSYSLGIGGLIIFTESLQEIVKDGKLSNPYKSKDSVKTWGENLGTGYETLKSLGKEYDVKISATPQYTPKNFP